MTNHPTITDNYQTNDLRGAEFTKRDEQMNGHNENHIYGA
jgi:hypothetical protein